MKRVFSFRKKIAVRKLNVNVILTSRKVSGYIYYRTEKKERKKTKYKMKEKRKHKIENFTIHFCYFDKNCIKI